MRSGLEDIMVVLEFAIAQKTPTVPVAAALERLRERVKRKLPVDVAFGHDDEVKP
jgi:hypothetical protein